MQTVAVALIDALGFRGILEHADPNLVVNTLRQFRQIAQTMTTEVGQWPSPVTFHAQVFSDTLMLAAAVSEPTRPLKQQLLELLGPAVAHFTRNALLCELPLAFRGCIALGQGLLEDGILVGQAVDEAAENYERADAACVWLLDDARDAVESISPESRTGYWFLHHVPLVERKRKKDEAAVRQTLVVNPCGPAREDHRKLSHRMCLAFDRGEHALREDVQRKRQLTVHFLEECSRASKDWWSERGFPNAATC